MYNILIIEDEKDLSDTIESALQEFGYEVKIVGTSAAGLDSVKESKPDLIFLDIMTGSLHGVEFLKKLRELPEGLNNSKVIVLTNLDNNITKDQIVDYKVSDYIVKTNSSINDIISKAQRVLAE